MIEDKPHGRGADKNTDEAVADRRQVDAGFKSGEEHDVESQGHLKSGIRQARKEGSPILCDGPGASGQRDFPSALMGWAYPCRLPVKKQPGEKRKTEHQGPIDEQRRCQVGINSGGDKDSLCDERGDQANQDRKHPRGEKRTGYFQARISGTAFQSPSQKE